MRSKTVRMKRIKYQRAVDDFMRMPTRIVAGSIDYREVNEDALRAGHIWALPETSPVPSNAHWLINTEFGWACQGCKWTGDSVKDFWKVHPSPPEEVKF